MLSEEGRAFSFVARFCVSGHFQVIFSVQCFYCETFSACVASWAWTARDHYSPYPLTKPGRNFKSTAWRSVHKMMKSLAFKHEDEDTKDSSLAPTVSCTNVAAVTERRLSILADFTPTPHRTKITCFNTSEQQTRRQNGTIFYTRLDMHSERNLICSKLIGILQDSFRKFQLS